MASESRRGEYEELSREQLISLLKERDLERPIQGKQSSEKDEDQQDEMDVDDQPEHEDS